MSPSKNSEREARQARERLRTYQAKQTVHEKKATRRRRDNWFAAGLALVIVTLAIVGQVIYFAQPTTPHPSDSPSASALSLPSKTLAENRTWTGTLTINGIPLGVSLNGKAAPQAVSSTLYLVDKKFYNKLTCHRLTTEGIFVLQCGDPHGDGSGGPGYEYGPIENAPSDNVYPTGTIAMARVSDNASSQGSQFFIVYKTSTIPADEAGGYTIIGHITSNLDSLISAVVDKGVQNGATDGKPVVPTIIDSFTLH